MKSVLDFSGGQERTISEVRLSFNRGRWVSYSILFVPKPCSDELGRAEGFDLRSNGVFFLWLVDIVFF